MIKGTTLSNDCLICSIVGKIWFSVMGRLFWVWNYRAKSLFILSFIYLFLSVFAHAIVRAYKKKQTKKKKKKKKKKPQNNNNNNNKKNTKKQQENVTCSSSGRVSGCQTKQPYVVYFIAMILLKLCGCTCWSGTLLVICFLARRHIFHVSLSLL